MRGSYRPIFLAFITFLVNGLTYGQELYCGPFCLASEASCTCTFSSQGFLTWKVTNATGDDVGLRIVDQDDVGKMITLLGGEAGSKAAALFDITVMNNMDETFTSELSFTTLPEFQGYMIECTVGASSSNRTINIPGTPSLGDLNVASFNASSVVLTFEVSAGSDCVANYSIKTNASIPSPSITDTSVTLSKPKNGAEDVTYYVCVSAVDFAGRSESPSCLDCFRFSPPNAVIFYDVSYIPMMSDDNCTAMIKWTAYNCFPPLTSYNVIVTNSSAEVTMSDVSTAAFQFSNVTYDEEYTVTVTPSNALGAGMPASTIFIAAPTNCAESTEGASTPSPSPSGSASLLLPGPGVLSVGVIAGFIISFGFS